MDFHQISRPSAVHSFVILASHVFFLPGVYQAWRLRFPVELVSLCLVTAVSLLYHTCDENLFCAFDMSITQWHATDVWVTFLLICFLLGVMALDLKTWVAAALRCVYFVWVSAVVLFDATSLFHRALLILSVTALIIWRYGMQKHHKHTSLDVASLVQAWVIFGVAQVAFFLAITPIVGRRLHADATPKPIALPDTTVYWLFHSLWHLFAAVSVLKGLAFKASGAGRGGGKQTKRSH